MCTKHKRRTHEVEVSEVVVSRRRHDDVPEVDDFVVPHVSEDEHLPVDALGVHLPGIPTHHANARMTHTCVGKVPALYNTKYKKGTARTY